MATKTLRCRWRWQANCCDDTDGALMSTFLSSGLALAKEELRSSWWTRARRYRNSSARLGMGNPGAAAEVKVETSLGEVLSRWRQGDDWIIWLNSGGLFIPGRRSVAQMHKNLKNDASVCLIKYKEKIKIVLLFIEGRKILKIRLYAMWHVPQGNAIYSNCHSSNSN